MGRLNETHKDNETQTIFNAESETNFNLSDVNLFEKEVENSMNFEVLKKFIKVTNNLKEYVSYEIDKLKNSVSNVIIGQLKEENNYLKEEIRDIKNLLREVVLVRESYNKNYTTETLSDK